MFGVEAEAGSVLGAGGGERGTPVDAVGLLVATGVEVPNECQLCQSSLLLISKGWAVKHLPNPLWSFPVGTMVKKPPANAGD